MNTLEILTSTLGWSLIHATWQIMLAAVIVRFLLHVFRESSSAVKYNIVMGGLLSSFGAFCITLAIMAGSFATKGTDPGSLPEGTILYNLSGPEGTAGSNSIGNDLFSTIYYRLKHGIDGSLNYIILSWLTGFLFFSLRFFGGYVYIFRLKHRYSSRLPVKWQSRLRHIQARLKMNKAVTLLESASVKIPVVIGHIKPAIILPIGLVTHIPFNQLEAVLVHELAHIRRNDYLMNLILSSMEWVFFYHPLYWWMSNRLDLYREHCCDDITINYCGRTGPLQKALLDLSTYNHKTPNIAAALYRNEHQLLNRIKRMKTKNQENRGNKFTPAALLGVVAVFAILTLGSSFVPRPDDMVHGIIPNPDEIFAPDSIPVPEPPAPVVPAVLEEPPEPADVAPPLPDTTLSPNQKSVVMEIHDEGVIRIKVDGEGNLLSAEKDGKQLSGKDREKYERLAARLYELQEEGKSLEQKEEDLQRIKERLKETELKMKEIQQEYSEVMKDYMKVQSEAGWNAYKDAWGLHSGEPASREELEKWIQMEQNLAGVYNQDLFNKQKQWTDMQNDLMKERFEGNEQWEAFSDQFNDQYRQSMEQYEEQMKKMEIQRQLDNDKWRSQIEEAKKMNELSKTEMKQALFEEVIRSELVKDGLLENQNDKLVFELSDKRLVVNGKKQNSELHDKYKDLCNKYTDIKFNEDTRFIIKD